MTSYSFSASPAAVMATRPALRYAAFALTAALVFLLYQNVNLLPHATVADEAMSHFGSQLHLSVAVVETKGCHDEVTSSFFSAFGYMENVAVEGYLKDQRFRVDALYEQLPGLQKRHLYPLDDFEPSALAKSNPDIVLSITSEYDLKNKLAGPVFKELLANTNAILFAVVHHPNEISTRGQFELYRPWMESNRLRFITLSDHVTTHLQTNILQERWQTFGSIDTTLVPVSTFPPVFEIPSIERNATSQSGDLVRFAMQGDLLTNRIPNRSYGETFQRLAEVVASVHMPPFELYVLGDGCLPDVPEAAKETVHFETGLPYLEFYSILHSAVALLPALASPDYLKIKASSSVPAAMIAASPLVADKDLLEAYSYLQEDDVYLRHDGEDEVAAIERIAKMPEEQRQKKAARVADRNALLTRHNGHLMEFWVQESLALRFAGGQQ